MKNYPNLIALFISVLLLLSCEKQTSKVIISGIITGAEIPYITYTTPIHGYCFGGFMDTVPVKASGEFEIVFHDLKESSFSFIKIPELNIYNYFIVEPGDSIHFIFTNTEETLRLDIKGNNVKGQEYCIQNSKKSLEGLSNQLKDIELNYLHNKVEELKEQDLEFYRQLLDKAFITPSFYELIYNQTQCLYASVHALAIYKKIDFDDIDEALVSSLKEVIAAYPLASEELFRTRNWFDYVQSYMLMYIPLFEKQSREDMIKKHQENTFYSYYMEKLGEVLSPKQLAFFKASYIYFVSLQMEYPRELPEIYEQMFKEYPQNPCLGYITSYIEDVKRYYSIIDKPFSESVTFIENYAEINSLKEVIDVFKGKRVYVDVWATWCGPCKREFQYKDALKDYLKETNTEIIYISFDQDSEDAKWKEMIKYYGLDGYHMRVNEELRADLFVHYDKNGRIAIPWYLLFDENGNMIEKHASAPSQITAD